MIEIFCTRVSVRVRIIHYVSLKLMSGANRITYIEMFYSYFQTDDGYIKKCGQCSCVMQGIVKIHLSE